MLILTITKAVAAPQSSLTWFNLGVAQYNQKKFSSAKESFSQAILLKTKLVDAALFYSAMSEFNQEKYNEIPALMNKIDNTSIFYNKGQDLLVALENNTDPLLKQALVAYQDFEYESCLELVEDSVFVDHPKGITLHNTCKEEIDAEKLERSQENTLEINKSQKTAKFNSQFYYYADLNTGYTNNYYLVNTSTTGRGLYQIAIGAEYILQKNYDLGVGLNYAYNNVVNLTNASDSLINIYVPLTNYFENSDIVLEAYLNSTQYNSANSYRQTGANATYHYYTSDFVLGVTLDASIKNAVLTTYNYMNGNYTFIKGAVAYIFNKNSFSTYLMVARNNTEDQSVTGGSIPYANNEAQLGAAFSFWLTNFSRIIANATFTKTNYLNKLSANNIFRADSENHFKLKFENVISKNIKLYAEASSTNHISNYDDSELANKNYKEAALTLGLYLSN